MVCATSKGSDQPAHTRRLIRAFTSWVCAGLVLAFASCTVKLMTENHLELLNLKRGCTSFSESTHVKMLHCRKTHVTAQIILKILTHSHFLGVFLARCREHHTHHQVCRLHVKLVVTIVLMNPDYTIWKHRRSRSKGFWWSYLIRVDSFFPLWLQIRLKCSRIHVTGYKLGEV